MWTCSQCGTTVDASAAACATCGVSRYAIRDPDVPLEAPAPAAQDEPMPALVAEEEPPIDRERCPTCGSRRVIPDVVMIDQGRGSDGQLQLAIIGNPKALFFKDLLYGVLRAWVCGRCGHVDLRVTNPEELYAKYLEAQERGK